MPIIDPPPHKIVDLLLSYKEFLIAVAVTYDSFEKEKRQPRSESKWIIDKMGRSVLRENIVGYWRRITNQDANDFPFNMKMILWAWLTVGKDSERKLLAWAQGQQPTLFI